MGRSIIAVPERGNCRVNPTEQDTISASALPARLLDAVPDAIIVFDAEINILYANQAALEFIGPTNDRSADESTPAQTLDATTLVHPDDLEQALLDLVPIIATRGMRGTSRVRIVNAVEVRPIEVTFVNLLDDPHVRGIVASFRDLRGEEQAKREAQAKQALIERNDALREELLERQAFQARLLQIQQSISRRMPVDDVLRAVVDGAHALLADEIVVLFLDGLDSGPRTVVELFGGALEATTDAAELARPGSLERFARDEDQLVVLPFGESGIVGRRSVAAGMAVPIRDRDRALGSLAVATDRDDRLYSPLEREMLVNLAEHASVALMDARTVEHVQLALRDSLTGLPSRALLMDRLLQSAERCARDGDPIVVLFIDLARFKGINDSYGHAVGDEVLATVGRRIAATMREYDTAARLGGDEFVVVLERVSAREAMYIAQRILAEIRKPIQVARARALRQRHHRRGHRTRRQTGLTRPGAAVAAGRHRDVPGQDLG